MENIFNKLTIPTSTYFFNSSYSLITHHLFDYLYNNLYDENYFTFTSDLRNALKTNANGEYI
jgi:hypothetical protein